MLRLDCANLETHGAITDFSHAGSGVVAHPAHGCAAQQLGIGGCPPECAFFRAGVED